VVVGVFAAAAGCSEGSAPRGRGAEAGGIFGFTASSLDEALRLIFRRRAGTEIFARDASGKSMPSESVSDMSTSSIATRLSRNR
jgi:hypothetical protein